MATVGEQVRSVRLGSYAVVAGAATMSMLFALEAQALGWGMPSPSQNFHGLWLVVILFTWVSTSAWLSSLRTLAEDVVPEAPHRRSSMWTLLGWVVPIINLWFPYQVVADLVRAFDARVRGLLVWWAAWLVATQLHVSDVVGNRGLAWTAGPKWVQVVAWAVGLLWWCWIVVELTRAAEAAATSTTSPVPSVESAVTP